MNELICKCCGGDIDPKTATCRYCDTVYVKGYVCREETYKGLTPIAAIDKQRMVERRKNIESAMRLKKYGL